jgi:hypothetical protein
MAARDQARWLSHHGEARPQRRAALHAQRIRLAGRFPQIVEAVSKLKVRSCFIDGEAIVVDEAPLGF